MAKVNKAQCKSESRCHRVKSWTLSTKRALKKNDRKTRCAKTSEEKDWKGATCSVCLEVPHNAVLLLCSSYHKGCRPYMCATSRRFSNCLEQYKKAYTKVTSIERMQHLNTSSDNSSVSMVPSPSDEKMEVPELLCPLCRGQVKGWTVVEAARKYLNSKKRACMQDKCSFVGSYKELRKHVKAKHPLARPRAVDPVLEEKWKKLECERERSDVISTIMSSTPGAVVLGDYVIEPYRGVYGEEYDSDDSLSDDYFNLESFDRGQSSVHPRHRFHHYDLDENDFGMHRFLSSRAVAAPGRAFRRVLLARSRWTRRGNGSR